MSRLAKCISILLTVSGLVSVISLDLGCAVRSVREAAVADRQKWAKKQGASDLHLAAHEGNSTQVLHLLKQGGDANRKDDRGLTPLMVAIQQGHIPVVSALIENGADPGIMDHEGNTALHHAALNGQLDAVKALIPRSNLVDPVNKKGQSPLFHAVYLDYPEIARHLVRHGANVTVRDPNGDTLLHHAANHQRIELIDTFVGRGLDVNVMDNRGQTVLMVAAWRGDIATVQFILRQAAQVNAVDQLGQTSIYLAASGGHEDIVRRLLESGADPNIPTKESRTAMHVAALNGHIPLTEYLAAHGARASILGTTEKDSYATAVVHELLARKATENSQSSQATDYLSVAAQHYHRAATQYADLAARLDSKIFRHEVLTFVGDAFIVAAMAGIEVVRQEGGRIQARQMAEVEAIREMSESGQPYNFALARAYENAFRSQYNATVADPLVGRAATGLLSMWENKRQQEKGDLERLRELYRKISEDALRLAKECSRRSQ